MREEEYKKRARKRFMFRAAALLFAVCVIAAIGIANFFVPFRTLLPAYSLGKREEGEVRVHFLDVGQGDCAVIELPDGAALMIDAGDGSWENNNHILRYLKGLGSPALTLVATHADADHCGGFPAVFEAFTVEKVFLPVLSQTGSVYEAFLERAKEYPNETLTRYSLAAEGEAYAVCVSPYSRGESSENDSSAVLYFSYAGVNVLFGADISAEREMQLLNEQKLSEELGEHLFDSGKYAVRLNETDILKVSHHGSAGSSSAAWLNMLSPKTAVVSCGAGNLYRHPAGDALARLAAAGTDVYRTDELGDIMITIFKDGTYKTEYGYCL